MKNWQIEPTEEYGRAYKYYEKKHPEELTAVLDNLKRYFQTISCGVHPQFVVAGYIHNEKNGLRAIDQRGGRKRKLQQTRLYIYSDVENSILYLITIGDKTSQKNDIKLSTDFIMKLRGK